MEGNFYGIPDQKIERQGTHYAPQHARPSDGFGPREEIAVKDHLHPRRPRRVGSPSREDGVASALVSCVKPPCCR